jgi:hypothetical protein
MIAVQHVDIAAKPHSMQVERKAAVAVAAVASQAIEFSGQYNRAGTEEDADAIARVQTNRG